MIENLLVRSWMFAIRHTHWRRLVRDAKNPLLTQDKVLQAILRDNRRTQYGRAHNFDRIASYDQFAEQVPVVTYETLRPYIEDQLCDGTSALTSAPPAMYATTSGTTGKPKYVPVIRAELQHQKRHTALLTYSQYEFDPLAFSGKVWVMAASASEGHFDNGAPWGSASGFLYASMSPAIAKKYLIPAEVFAIEDNGLKYDLILRLALGEKNITYFSAANPTTLLRLCALANQRGHALAEDIGHGIFSRASELTSGVTKAIQGRLTANLMRAAELRNIFDAGQVVNFRDLWPALRLVSTWTGGNCGVAAQSARALLPVSTKIVELGYLSSEFCGTIPVDCKVTAGLPNITDYFYEFIEPAEWEAGIRKFRLVHQLESGRDYYVVITTPSGLYRYFINDIVRAEGRFKSTPMIRFVQKGKGVTNITGEKLYESQFVEAVDRAGKNFAMQPDFYLMLADVERQTYHLYLDVSGLMVGEAEIAAYFDDSLAELNTEYHAKRESGRLNPLEITLLRQGTGELYRTHCIQSGQKDGQFKMVTLQYSHQCFFPFHSHARSLQDVMKIDRLEVIFLEIPFKTSFKHASASRAQAASVWVEAYATQGRLVGYGEGCPREYVTGENIKSALDWINRYQSSIVSEITSLEMLKNWVLKQEQMIDKDPAAWCAVELALLDLLAKSEGRSLEALLSSPPLPSSFQYSAVLGDDDDAGFSRQASKYMANGFLDFKIKLSGDLKRDIGKIDCLNSYGMPVKIRGDANNIWRKPSDVIDYLNQLGQPFWAIEEPLAPRDFEGMSEIAARTGIKIILDESFSHAGDLIYIKDAPDIWIPNLRVSKLGGLVRSVDLLGRVRSLGLQIIIGAHVGETSVLTRAGLALAAAAGDARVAMEGAFGTHLLEYDVCDPPLMFDKGGKLLTEEWNFINAAGNGLAIKR